MPTGKKMTTMMITEEWIKTWAPALTQEYAVESYAREYAKDQRRLGEIKGIVETCQEFGVTAEETGWKLMDRFGMSVDEAGEWVREYWVR